MSNDEYPIKIEAIFTAAFAAWESLCHVLDETRRDRVSIC
jgi:hypothetical protein